MKKESQNNPSIHSLNHLLAAYTVAAQNARFCHWNVLGPVFEDNHEIFGDIYDMLSEQSDVFAEQVRILGEYPISKLSEYLHITTISELEGTLSAADMQKALHDNLLHISDEMSKFIDETDNDPCTQDVIIAAKKDLDKKRWMLRALLGKK
ncbi:MAG: DNA starvation/stationary phase protection protein [Candidatus Altimarinota bacterium]